MGTRSNQKFELPPNPRGILALIQPLEGGRIRKRFEKIVEKLVYGSLRPTFVTTV